MRFSEFFYNHGDRVINPSILAEVRAIVEVGVGCEHRSSTNRELADKFRHAGWSVQAKVHSSSRMRMDFKKNDVGMEVQFRQDTNLIHDLLKLELAVRHKSIASGIIITYDESVAIVGQHSMGACAQRFQSIIEEFGEVINFRIPLWVVGVMPCV